MPNGHRDSHEEDQEEFEGLSSSSASWTAGELWRWSRWRRGSFPPRPSAPTLFTVDLTFQDCNNRFWRIDEYDRREQIALDLVIWLDEERAVTCDKHRGDVLEPRFGVRPRFEFFDTAEEVQETFNSRAEPQRQARDRAPPDVLVDELLAMGEQFRTADGRSVAVQMGRRGDMYHAWPVFASLGGTMAGLKPDGTYESADKWKPKLVEAFQRMAELRRTAPHVFEPSLSRRDALALFLRGGTQYLITSCGGLGEVLEHGNIPVEAYPVPRAGTFPASPLVTVTTFYLPKSSKNQMVAKDLLSFYLARPNTGIELNEVRPWPPVQRNVLSRVLPKRTTLAAYNDAVHAGVLMPSHPQMRSVVWRCLTDLQLRIADGEQDVRGLAQAAADTLESLDLPGSS